GAVLEDRDVIAHLDRTLAPGRQSAVIPVKYNKDGNLSEHSAVLSAEDFSVIGEYAERKIRDAGARIVSGDAEINPYRLGQETACTYCPYREICGFDERIPGYRYRELARLNAESALARMKEIINEVDA
ncbi:MAG: PD-(D/E)XK nuclease family protein, partial [Lachnospiraceae bacterium]|nr:PD-(D/E)XK nuclease family protein [Lachnospiraceae bacterium]